MDTIHRIQDAMLDSLTSIGTWDLPMLLAGIISSITMIILWTRLTSGNPPGPPSSKARSPPSSPYWIPFVGHLPQYLFDIEGTINDAKQFSTGIFILLLGTEKHHVVYGSGLVQKLHEQNGAKLSGVEPIDRILRNVFDVPKGQVDLYQKAGPAADSSLSFAVRSMLSSAQKDGLLRHMLGNLPDLVTFNVSPIDQESWERVSAVKASLDEGVAELSLLPLTFVFLTHMATDSLLSESLLFDSDHHEVAPLLLAFIQSYPLLATGVPRMVPHPTLPTAHITRRQLYQHLDKLIDVFEDSEVQGQLLAARQKVFNEHNASSGARIADLLRLLFSVNSPNILAFWMLTHVVSDSDLLQRVREEASKVIKITQEEAVMGFSVPPRLSVDTAALLSAKTPVLESCWLETVRLYSRGGESYVLTDDVELEGDAIKVFKGAEKWTLKKGDWVETNNWLSNTDASNWKEPEKWDSERHLLGSGPYDEDVQSKVEQKPGPHGMDALLPISKLFATAFVAGAVLLFDFETDPAKSIPKPQLAGGVALPVEDFRVRLRKRPTTSKA